MDLVRRLAGRLVLGVTTGIGLALAPTTWSLATHAETHTLHLAFVAILLWLLVAWDDRVRGWTDDDPGAEDRGDRFLIAAVGVSGSPSGTTP